jgi:RNA polymerase sigma-70 factor (ECF subfamily)
VAELTKDLRDDTRTAWHVYLDSLNAFRPDFFGFCLKLTRDVWDAEDLAHDALIRGFATLGVVHQDVKKPRAYLLRIAANLWIDRVRRRALERDVLESGDTAVAEPTAPAAPDRGVDLRKAGAALMERLTTQERAAVLLKDLFDLSLEEAAGILATSVGAVKTALHRGRGRLRDEAPRAGVRRRTASAELVDRFIDRLDAKDLPALLDMMLDSGAVEAGYLLEVGRDEFSVKGGWLWSACHGHPNRPRALDAWTLRHERREHRGESLILSRSKGPGAEGLTSVMRLSESEGHIARIHVHSDPDFVRALADELGVPALPFPVYRPPTPGPGKEWPPIESGEPREGGSRE